MKWASHFLRDLGLSHDQLAILDSQVLGALRDLGVMNLPSKGLSDQVYLDAEREFKAWAEENLREIPFDHLDLAIWELFRSK